ncbi:MAG: hypothetical protein LH616_06415 [Ilumatobacteraceae bacterium]|nr:hypothetical protein [Ilumatobacteraceae bacterium]
MAIERRVRFTEEFSERLDVLLPEERGVDGIPSVTDFLVFEVPPVRDRLAADAMGATMPTRNHRFRVGVTSGVLISRIAVYALVTEEEVDVFDLDLELDIDRT